MNDDPLLDIQQVEANQAEGRRLLEKDVEKSVCDYARRRYGMRPLKFTSPGRRSVPDQIFLCQTTTPVGYTFFIEFKAPGKKASAKQKKEHVRLRAMGYTVYVVDDIDYGKSCVDREFNRLKKWGFV